MIGRIKKAIDQQYKGATFWCYDESVHYVYARFTHDGKLYMAVLFNGASAVEFFGYEGGVMI